MWKSLFYSLDELKFYHKFQWFNIYMACDMMCTKWWYTEIWWISIWWIRDDDMILYMHNSVYVFLYLKPLYWFVNIYFGNKPLIFYILQCDQNLATLPVPIFSKCFCPTCISRKYWKTFATHLSKQPSKTNMYSWLLFPIAQRLSRIFDFCYYWHLPRSCTVRQTLNCD